MQRRSPDRPRQPLLAGRETCSRFADETKPANASTRTKNDVLTRRPARACLGRKMAALPCPVTPHARLHFYVPWFLSIASDTLVPPFCFFPPQFLAKYFYTKLVFLRGSCLVEEVQWTNIFNATWQWQNGRPICICITERNLTFQ